MTLKILKFVYFTWGRNVRILTTRVIAEDFEATRTFETQESFTCRQFALTNAPEIFSFNVQVFDKQQETRKLSICISIAFVGFVNILSVHQTVTFYKNFMNTIADRSLKGFVKNLPQVERNLQIEKTFLAGLQVETFFKEKLRENETHRAPPTLYSNFPTERSRIFTSFPHGTYQLH